MTTPSVKAPDPVSGQPSSAGRSRWEKTVGVLGLVVVFWVGDRLYNVIDSGGMGPGGDHEPGGPTPTTQPTDTDPAGGSDEHDPSQFDHG